MNKSASENALPAIDRVATMAHHAVDKAAVAAAPTAEWLSEQGDSLKATQKKLLTGATDYVTANPYTSIGVAVVAGFLLSRIFH